MNNNYNSNTPVVYDQNNTLQTVVVYENNDNSNTPAQLNSRDLTRAENQIQ